MLLQAPKSGGLQHVFGRGASVAVVVFVLLTIAIFALLGVVQRMFER
jgi:hypothetical protein